MIITAMICAALVLIVISVVIGLNVDAERTRQHELAKIDRENAVAADKERNERELKQTSSLDKIEQMKIENEGYRDRARLKELEVEQQKLRDAENERYRAAQRERELKKAGAA